MNGLTAVSWVLLGGSATAVLYVVAVYTWRAVRWLVRRPVPARVPRLVTEFRRCNACRQDQTCSVHPDGTWTCLTCMTPHWAVI
jgi:hypothetical protein